LTDTEQQVAPLREIIAGFDIARADAEQRLSVRTQELADVGERLTEARASEAALQQQLSVLTEETARLAAGSSEAEARVQEARDAEASLQTALTSATTELDRITAERDALVAELQEMTQRRDFLAADNAASTEQRDSIQAVVTLLSDDLAARSEQLAKVERRITDLQMRKSENATTDLPLQPGLYTVGPLEVTRGDDGRFVLLNDARGQKVTGGYTATEGLLTLTEAEGDTGTTPFPMTCALRQSGDGLVLEQSAEELCALVGLTIEVQQ
jgi:uncharacterized phage infection (PIP) family protein YhgE